MRTASSMRICCGKKATEKRDVMVQTPEYTAAFGVFEVLAPAHYFRYQGYLECLGVKEIEKEGEN